MKLKKIKDNIIPIYYAEIEGRKYPVLEVTYGLGFVESIGYLKNDKVNYTESFQLLQIIK